MVEHAGVGGGVGPRRTPDGRLVDVDDLVDALESLDRLVQARRHFRAVDALHERSHEDVVDERRLARTRHPGHGHETAQRELDIYVLEIVLAGATHHEGLGRRLAPQLRNRDLALARQVLPGHRRLGPQQAFDRARVDDVAAVLAGPGTDVDDMVGHPDGLLVVLNHQHGVAQPPEPLQSFDEPTVVPLVKADRRLVQHVEHADQPAADLRGQADALGLAAGQRRRRAREVEVVEPHVEQEAHASVDLLDHAVGDEMVALAEGEAFKRGGGLTDRHQGDVGDAVAVDGDGQRQGLEPGPAALRAGHLAHVALDLLALRVALGLGMAALQVGHDAFEPGLVAAAPPVAVLVLHLHPAGHAVQQQLLLGLGQLGPSHVRANVVGLAHRFEQAGEVLAATTGPRSDCSLGHGQVRVGHDELGVDLEAGTQPVAMLAGPVGRVEREGARCQLVE